MDVPPVEHLARIPPGPIRPLGTRYVADAAALLRSVGRWAADRGTLAWTAGEVGREALAAHAGRGELFGRMDGGALVGCMLLQTEDRTHWPEDRPGDALYLHKLAVKREAAGRAIGEALIAFACDAARRRGIAMLRLDTGPGTPLVAYYERQGFRPDPKGPADYAGRWLLRMEKRIDKEMWND